MEYGRNGGRRVSKYSIEYFVIERGVDCDGGGDNLVQFRSGAFQLNAKNNRKHRSHSHLVLEIKININRNYPFQIQSYE